MWTRFIEQRNQTWFVKRRVLHILPWVEVIFGFVTQIPTSHPPSL